MIYLAEYDYSFSKTGDFTLNVVQIIIIEPVKAVRGLRQI